jgi:hypothetical protein
MAIALSAFSFAGILVASTSLAGGVLLNNEICNDCGVPNDNAAFRISKWVLSFLGGSAAGYLAGLAAGFPITFSAVILFNFHIILSALTWAGTYIAFEIASRAISNSISLKQAAGDVFLRYGTALRGM